MKLALFDLDHTLLPLDSDYSWGEFTTQIGWTDRDEFAQRNDEFFAQYKAGSLDIADYVRFATAAIVAQGATKSIAAHDVFMRTFIDKAIQKPALDLLAAHRAAGDQIVIVTATNEFVTRPIASALGVDELIAVELAIDPQTRWYSGAIQGVPSAREGKVTRVEQWLSARGLSWAGLSHSVFYTDSINDIALMERVHEPVATNPDAALRAVALARGWRILELF
jgi:HAD superfamily hydrolase (TIGR01490 family)